MGTAVEIPNPHHGGLCPASADGGVGFYFAESLGDGHSCVTCPNGCGWWRMFDEATGEVVDGDHISPDSGSDAEQVVKRVEQVYDDAQVSAREFLRGNASPDSGSSS